MLVLALLICTIPIATAQSAKTAKAATENTMEMAADGNGRYTLSWHTSSAGIKSSTYFRTTGWTFNVSGQRWDNSAISEIFPDIALKSFNKKDTSATSISYDMEISENSSAQFGKKLWKVVKDAKVIHVVGNVVVTFYKDGKQYGEDI